MRLWMMLIGVAAAVVRCSDSTRADTLLHRYEADVVPHDPSQGWIVADACEEPCTESIVDGRLLFSWAKANNWVNYDYSVGSHGGSPSSSFFVEWRFRSNHALGPHFFDCDGRLYVGYESARGAIYMYGDAVIWQTGSHFRVGLDLDEFHTLRFESPDGRKYRLSVDGDVFREIVSSLDPGASYIQFGGDGGCLSDQFPNMRNEWDFVRFGTLDSGEIVVATDPPQGYLDARVDAARDHFTVTFDAPNYAYIRDIEVQASVGSEAPVVKQTRRRETNNQTAAVDIDPCVVEIVLDRPFPMGATTTFTFNDGVAVNVVEYAFAPGDTDGTGRVDLADAAYLQNCFAGANLNGACAAIDLDRSGGVDQLDTSLFDDELVGPRP